MMLSVTAWIDEAGWPALAPTCNVAKTAVALNLTLSDDTPDQGHHRLSENNRQYPLLAPSVRCPQMPGLKLGAKTIIVSVVAEYLLIFPDISRHKLQALVYEIGRCRKAMLGVCSRQLQ